MNGKSFAICVRMCLELAARGGLGVSGASKYPVDLDIEVLDLGLNGDVDGEADYFCRGAGGDGSDFFLYLGELVWFAADDNY